MDKKNIANYIEHTLLKPEVCPSHIKQLCQEALTYDFHAVCVNPSLVKWVHKYLKGSPVNTCSVAGFPLGATTTTTKLIEIETCLNDGASEIDMVMNIGLFKYGDLKTVANELKAVRQITTNKILKIIIETPLLSKSEIVTASKIVEASGADFIKTSTGFNGIDTTTENIRLIQSTIKSGLMIKASGGIKSLQQVKKVLAAGANRIGTSAGIIIMEEIPLD